MDDEERMDTQEAALRSIVGTGGHPHSERVLSSDSDLDLDAAHDTPDGGAGRTV